jgi:hypothetical protein
MELIFSEISIFLKLTKIKKSCFGEEKSAIRELNFIQIRKYSARSTKKVSSGDLKEIHQKNALLTNKKIMSVRLMKTILFLNNSLLFVFI